MEVRFLLDARKAPVPAPVGIRGNTPTLSWERSLPLTDSNGDGLLEGSFFVSANTRVLEFKFVAGIDPLWWEMEGANRWIVPGQPVNDLGILTWGQKPPVDLAQLPVLEAEALQEDLALAREALLAIHPGLFRYRTPQAIDSLFGAFQAKFSRDMTHREAYLLFSEMMGFFQCGHTYANFFNQNSFIQEVVFGQPDKLPFLFRWVEGRMIVTLNLSGTPALDKFSEVLAIQGVPVSDILSRLLPLVKADGANDAKRINDLNLLGVGPFESFDVYFPLLLPPVNGEYQLEVEDADGRKQRIVVDATTREERTRRSAEAGMATDVSAYWKLEFWENSTAYLQLATFDVFQLGFDWKPWLDRAFTDIRERKTERLVIDVRYNEGGQDEILLYLGRMLAKEPVRPVARQVRVRYEEIPARLRPHVFTWVEDAYDFRGRVKPLENGFFEYVEEEIVIKPARKAFQGEVFVLVNAANSSGTFYFAEIARENKLATLVGEPTGGSQKGLNAGLIFFLRLPNSGIELDIPVFGSFSEDLPAGGIQPDILVQETVESLRAGRDPVLEAVKR